MCSSSLGSPAENVGMRVGDIVTKFDGVLIKDGQHLIDVIKRHHAGDVCPMQIDRNGKLIDVEIMLR